MTKSFLNIADLNEYEINDILNLDSNLQSLEKKNIGMIFEKYSTRTRISFDVAISQLGGNSINIDFKNLNISNFESFEDTFLAFNCYLDGLVYRTNNHDKLILASKFFDKPIINALSDLSHPCQVLGDVLTLKEYFGNLDINILWLGDMNNVCFSHIELANLIPNIKLFICCPYEISSKAKWKMNSNIIVSNKIQDIDLLKIDCVMTDVFVSMNDDYDEEKVNLLKPYSVTSELMSKTSQNSVFMHCLPAKMGNEVTEEVFRSAKSIVWKQAYNRMVAQKKLLQFIYQ